MKLAPRNLVILATGWLAMLAVPAAAQTVAQANPPSEEAVVLSPFVVNSSQDQGYIATNTLSGSRVNTPLYTTPSVTSVFTRDFLDDIAANDLVEAYTFGLNVDALEQPEQSSNFRSNLGSDSDVRIRGLVAATARTYFVWDVNGDSYNIERIDFSRGPNNVLFGVGGFGGVVNTTTKRALIGRDVTRFQLRVGQWDLYRGQLDINRTIRKNVALRVNLLQQKEGGWKHHAKYDRVAMHLAGTWNIFDTPSASTVLRAEYEKFNSDRVIATRFPFRILPRVGTASEFRKRQPGRVVTGTALPHQWPARADARHEPVYPQHRPPPHHRSFGHELYRRVDRAARGQFEGNRKRFRRRELTVMLEKSCFRNFFVEFAFNRQREFSTRDRATSAGTSFVTLIDAEWRAQPSFRRLYDLGISI